MEEWMVETVPVLNDPRIFSTMIHATEAGTYYVINKSDGYLLDDFTPADAEMEYISNTTERDKDFREAYGL